MFYRRKGLCRILIVLVTNNNDNRWNVVKKFKRLFRTHFPRLLLSALAIFERTRFSSYAYVTCAAHTHRTTVRRA